MVEVDIFEHDRCIVSESEFLIQPAEKLRPRMTLPELVDPDGVRDIMNKKRTEKLLSYHNHKIWKRDDGRWRTFLPDPDKPKGRKLVSRATKDNLKALLCEYYSDQ